jgi:hypothetical protein
MKMEGLHSKEEKKIEDGAEHNSPSEVHIPQCTEIFLLKIAVPIKCLANPLWITCPLKNESLLSNKPILLSITPSPPPL